MSEKLNICILGVVTLNFLSKIAIESYKFYLHKKENAQLNDIKNAIESISCMELSQLETINLEE